MPSLEIQKIASLVEDNVPKTAAILDIGCGHGSKLALLKQHGFTGALGVDINPALVEHAVGEGLNAITLDEFDEQHSDLEFDLIIMSHIIEHFQYQDLIVFMEKYIGRLKKGGLLLIITPCMNPAFYDDFDHVKPYTHIGILDIFGKDKHQVQYHADINLELLDLYYFRIAYQLKFYRALALRTALYKIPGTINRLLHLLYRLSFRTIGRPVSWIGLFRNN